MNYCNNYRRIGVKKGIYRMMRNDHFLLLILVMRVLGMEVMMVFMVRNIILLVVICQLIVILRKINNLIFRMMMVRLKVMSVEEVRLVSSCMSLRKLRNEPLHVR